MYGILCPTQAEFRATLMHLGATYTPSSGPFPASSGTVSGKGCVICRCGIGKAAAAAATQWLVDAYHVTHLVVCGVAGSLVSDLKIGDVVVAEDLIPADCGIWNADGFCFTGAMVESDAGLSLSSAYPADPLMLAAAGEAIRKGFSGEDAPRLMCGRIVTCDQATFALERRQELAQAFSALAVEMEGAAVAQIAELNGIPCLVIRAISDEICFDMAAASADAAASGQLDISELRDSINIAAEHASRLAVAVLSRLT